MKIRLSVLVLFVVVTAAVAAGVSALLVNIYERKQEAKNPFLRVVELREDTEDPEIWGKNDALGERFQRDPRRGR